VRARSCAGEPEAWDFIEDGDPMREGDVFWWYRTETGAAFAQTIERDHPPWPPDVYPPEYPGTETTPD
jgi:hypothetical protein